MNVDLKNSTVVGRVFGPVSQVNNTGGGGFDLSNFIGEVAMTVAIGNLTAGDTNSVITLTASTSSTNNISNAVAYVPTSGSNAVTTTNNAAAVGDISIDTRNALRYLFAIPVITGGNSPAFPTAVIVRGVKKNQPGI